VSRSARGGGGRRASSFDMWGVRLPPDRALLARASTLAPFTPSGKTAGPVRTDEERLSSENSRILGVRRGPTERARVAAMEDPVQSVVGPLAEGCTRFAKQAVGVELDGTPDTLPILDHYLSLARQDEAPNREEILGLLTASAGAYFGEVVRRSLPGARWHLPDPADPAGWRIEFDHVFLAFNPAGMVREAITEADEEGWNAHLEVLAQDRALLAQSLDRVGAVRDEDYRRLAVRWETVEQAVAVLEGAAQARGETGRRFSAAVYAAALDPR